MNKFLTALALLLAALYAAYFTDWFHQTKIQIMHRSLPDYRNKNPDAVEPVTFYLQPAVKLRSIKVCVSDEYATNHHPHFLWNLMAAGHEVVVTDFPYGKMIKGMKPFIPGQEADPLQARTTYLLLLDGEKLKAEKEFKPRAGG
jgi:hypothetical protein